MCYKCNEISETIEIRHPYEYYNILSQIQSFIKDDVLTFVSGNCPLEKIQKGKAFPDDVLYHVFKCSNCSREFELCVEIYHGSGGRWIVKNT